MFGFTEDQYNIFMKWDITHECDLKEYSSAIGGRITYKFTPTVLGTIVKVECGCGAELDLTDYMEW